MLQKPTCLHIPPIHKGETVEIAWETVNGATAYDLGLRYDESFEQSSYGKTWGDIQKDEASWNAIQANSLSWQAIHNLPTEFTLYKGLGVPPAWTAFGNQPPDNNPHTAYILDIPFYNEKIALRVCAINATEYSEFNTSALIDILPRKLAGCTPPCLHIPALYREGSVDIVWGELFDASAYVLERKLDNNAFIKLFEGLGTADGFTGCDKSQELLGTPDCKRHFSFTDTIPTGVSTAVYRIKGVNSVGQSLYLTSETKAVLSRSLTPYTPPCLHIPTLYEGLPAELVWGELYDVQGYVLEYQINGGAFTEVFRGNGTPVQQQCGNAGAHFTCGIEVPVGAQTMALRIKAYNTTNESAYFTQGVLPVIPAEKITLTAVKNSYLPLQIDGQKTWGFENAGFSLLYQPNELELVSFTSQPASSANPYDVQASTGRIDFKCAPNISAGEEWSGLITKLRFKALISGQTPVRLIRFPAQ